MSRRKDVDWKLPDQGLTWEHANIAVLMDIRDELKALNRIIGCQNFIEVPRILRSIDRKITKAKRKAGKKR